MGKVLLLLLLLFFVVVVLADADAMAGVVVAAMVLRAVSDVCGVLGFGVWGRFGVPLRSAGRRRIQTPWRVTQ